MKTIEVFGYKTAFRPHITVPVIDAREISNPFRRHLTDRQMKDEAMKDRKFPVLLSRAVALLSAHDTIAIGCSFGRHRSVALAERVAEITGARVVRLAETGNSAQSTGT